MLLTWKLGAQATGHARNLHPVHLADMSMWVSFSPPYLSANMDHLFDDAAFASVMYEAKCSALMTLICGFSKALTYFGLAQESIDIFWSFPRKTEKNPNASTCNCTTYLKKTKPT